MEQVSIIYVFEVLASSQKTSLYFSIFLLLR